MKLLIGIPTVDYIHFKFVDCLTKLEKRLNELKVDYDIWFKHCTMIHLGRDEIALHAIKNGYDKLLWFDADMIFEPDIFEKLNSVDSPYVCGLFVSRHGGKSSCVFEQIRPDIRYKEYPDNPFPIQASGFGCVLTDVKMLERIYNRNGTCFMPLQGYGEDLSFGIRVKDYKYSMMCNPDATVGHIGQAVIWPKDRDYDFI